MVLSAILSDNTILPVAPGGEATCEVKLRNESQVVDQFSFEILGDSARWATVEPQTVSLFPGGEGSVTVHFRPPHRASTPAGYFPFGIKITSSEEPDSSTVVEGALDVARFSEQLGEILPRTSRGRFSAKHQISLSNRGNAGADFLLGASDPDDLLHFELPEALVVESSTVGFAKLKVKPRKRYLWGPAQSHPFTAVAESAGDVPITLNASMVQESIIPKWLPKALLALAALAAVWFFLLKPAVKSAAQDAVKNRVDKAGQLALQASKNAAAAQQAATDAQATAGRSKAIATSTQGKVAENTLGDPIDGRLDVDSSTATSTAYTVPGKKTLSITDLVLENPSGDAGTVTIQRVSADGSTTDTLLKVALENFRDLDYHFVSPFVFLAGEQLKMAVTCGNTTTGIGPSPSPQPTPTAVECSDAVYYAGFIKSNPKK